MADPPGHWCLGGFFLVAFKNMVGNLWSNPRPISPELSKQTARRLPNDWENVKRQVSRRTDLPNFAGFCVADSCTRVRS